MKQIQYKYKPIVQVQKNGLWVSGGGGYHIAYKYTCVRAATFRAARWQFARL
jgi:hypothetical protein